MVEVAADPPVPVQPKDTPPSGMAILLLVPLLAMVNGAFDGPPTVPVRFTGVEAHTVIPPVAVTIGGANTVTV